MASCLKGGRRGLDRLLLLLLLFCGSCKFAGSREASKSKSRLKRGERAGGYDDESSSSFDAVGLVEQELHGGFGKGKETPRKRKERAKEPRPTDRTRREREGLKEEKKGKGKGKEKEKKGKGKKKDRHKADGKENKHSSSDERSSLSDSEESLGEGRRKFLMGEDMNPHADVSVSDYSDDTSDLSSTVTESSAERHDGGGGSREGERGEVFMMRHEWRSSSGEEEEEEEEGGGIGEETRWEKGAASDREVEKIEDRLLSSMSKYSHQQQLPAGFGDPSFVAPHDMRDISQHPDSPVFVCKGAVKERKIEPDIMSKSMALVYEAAEELGERYLEEATFLARLPHRRKEDGSIPEYLEQNKEETFMTWLYEGVAPNNSKTFDNLIEYVGARSKLSAGIVPGTTEASETMWRMEQRRIELEKNMTLEGGGSVQKSRALTWDEAMQERALARRPDEDEDEDEDEEGSDPTAGRITEQPRLDEREKELIMINKELITKSLNNESFEMRETIPIVVPRWVIESYGDAYKHLLPQKESLKQQLAHRDAAGNTIRAIMSAKTLRSLVPVKSAGPLKLTEEEKKEKALAEQAEKDRKLSKYEYVEKYREEVEEIGATALSPVVRKTWLIEQAARKHGHVMKGRSLSHYNIDGVTNLSAVPKNVWIPPEQYRNMRRKLKERYEKAKKRAREQGDQLTPELIKAKEALRYSAGTRNDIIARGARFGKLEEHRLSRRRKDRATGKRRRGPYGLMMRGS